MKCLWEQLTRSHMHRKLSVYGLSRVELMNVLLLHILNVCHWTDNLQMQKQGLGHALAAATDNSLHCSLKKLILLSSERLIRAPGSDRGHEQRDSQHVSTFGILFPLVSTPISFPGMLCLWKAQSDTLRDLTSSLH